MASRRWRSSVAPLLLVALGCGAEVDNETYGAVAGDIVDMNQISQPDVDLAAFNLDEECDRSMSGGNFATARSDATGRFILSVALFLRRPTTYCFDLELGRGELVDTIRSLQVSTFEVAPPPDTTRATLIVSW